MDRSMPVMGGMECTRRLRKMYGAGLVIVGLTGDAMEADQQEFRGAGLDEVLSKPSGPGVIRSVWESLTVA